MARYVEILQNLILPVVKGAINTVFYQLSALKESLADFHLIIYTKQL